jgi:hypothetical protein
VENRFVNGANMDKEEIYLDVSIRAFGEMVIEILENEGIEAALVPGDSITSALGSDKGVADWKIVVPIDFIERAKQILDELQQAGELAEFEFVNGGHTEDEDEEIIIEDFDTELI